jgi:hypothetical protein
MRATVTFDKSNTFCYILFEAPFVYLGEVEPYLQSDSNDLVVAMPKGTDDRHWRFVSRQYCYDKKLQFPSYADAIVWLTKIKLSLTNKPEKYRLFSVANIVEGYYTKGKHERVTRVTDLTNVSHSLPTLNERRNAKQRQLREQRQQQLRYAKTVAAAARKAKRASPVRGSWTTTGGSTATSVGGGWDEAWTVSVSNGSTTSCFN